MQRGYGHNSSVMAGTSWWAIAERACLLLYAPPSTKGPAVESQLGVSQHSRPHLADRGQWKFLFRSSTAAASSYLLLLEL